MLVAFIVRVHGYGGIAQHGFRASGGNNQIVFAVFGFGTTAQGITQMPEMALFFLVLYFKVGDGGVELRVPVHQALATVYQSFIIKPYKDFLNRLVKAVVHGEALMVPIHGVA